MGKIKAVEYEALLEPLKLELVAMARWAKATGARILIVFEGRDTAGKGGAIGAISQGLNPRQCRVVALGKPTESEKTQWYFQRHVAHLPSAGEIVLFDRSWYNRAGVEQIMGFASADQVSAFLGSVVLYIPNVIVAIIILLIGILVAKFLEGTVRASVKAAGLASANFLGTMTRWAVLIFTLLVALSQLEVADEIVRIVIIGLVAAASLAVGLSFGLGGVKHADEFLGKIRRRIED